MNNQSIEKEAEENSKEVHALDRQKTVVFKIWNRKIHIYLGLYFLLFIWLFTFSGLLLNNPEWSISNYWPDREEIFFQSEIESPSKNGDLAIAKDLMRQLDIRGEVHETRRGASNDEFSAQVRRPGQILNIAANFETGLAEITEIRVNTWGVIRMLHTFSGVKSQTDERRNWLLTKIWSFSMDALAVGLIIIVLSGLYMWYFLKQKRKVGLVVLALGTGCSFFFLFGLALIF